MPQTEYDLGPASRFPVNSRTVLTDGCFVDGVTAATGCAVGYRTLRVDDYGKVAAVFLNVQTERAVGAAPRLDIRDRADAFIPEESQHDFAQMQACQFISDEEMLTFQDVKLNTAIRDIVSRPGFPVNCEVCGEEIMNELEIDKNGSTLCRTCAVEGYFQSIFAYKLSPGLISK